MVTTRSRTGTQIKKPDYYVPSETVLEDDYAEHEYDSDFDSDIETEEEYCSDDDDEDEDEDDEEDVGSLKDFVVDDEEEDDT